MRSLRWSVLQQQHCLVCSALTWCYQFHLYCAATLHAEVRLWVGAVSQQACNIFPPANAYITSARPYTNPTPPLQASSPHLYLPCNILQTPHTPADPHTTSTASPLHHPDITPTPSPPCFCCAPPRWISHGTLFITECGVQESDSVRAGLLGEQAALSLIQTSPPSLRKFAFTMVLAGLKYLSFSQRALGIRCYL